MMPYLARRSLAHAGLVAILLPAILLYNSFDLADPKVTGEQQAEVEVLSVKTTTLTGSRGPHGSFRGASRHTHARVRLKDGAEAVVMLNGMEPPAVGAQLNVLVTDYDDGSRHGNPVLY